MLVVLYAIALFVLVSTSAFGAQLGHYFAKDRKQAFTCQVIGAIIGLAAGAAIVFGGCTILVNNMSTNW